MSHIHEGPLATYNSLVDSHLRGYFANTRMRRHLRRAGLITKHGDVVTESTYRLNMSRKAHKQQVKDMLAQAIVHKTLDLERTRQAEIKKKLEEIAKIQLVQRVRASLNRQGDEDVLPLLSPRSKRPGSSPARERQKGHRSGHSSRSRHLRPKSAPGIRADSRLSQVSLEEEGDVLYLDDDGRPIEPYRTEHDGDQNVDSRNLHSLDTTALRKYAMMMARMEEGQGVTSPYLMPQVPLPPRTPLGSSRTPRSGRRIHSVSPKRPVTSDVRIGRLHRPETAKSHEGELQMLCKVRMHYYGSALHLPREQMDPTQEVVIEQQHCGGNTLTVFKDRLKPGSDFEFISYRHRGYPFSLSLYLNGQMDSRVSTCCEYRHRKGAKIGGKQGHFGLVGVDGAVPCYKCQVAKGVVLRNKAPPKTKKHPAYHPTEEVVVVACENKRHKKAEMVNDDEKDGNSAVEKKSIIVPVENDTQKEKFAVKSTSQSEMYKDDFEDAKSDSSKSSSSSRSSRLSKSSKSSKSRSSKSSKSSKSSRSRSSGSSTSGSSSASDSGEGSGMESDADRKGKEQAIRKEEKREFTPRPPSTKPTRAEVNGTGREIDDFSSDDGSSIKRKKVIRLNNTDDEETKIRSRKLSSSLSSSVSSSSSSSSSSKQEKGPKQEEPTPVVSVEALDREEKEEARRRQEQLRRQELRRQAEEKQAKELQEEREKERRLVEERRQSQLFEQQMEEERKRKKEEAERRRQEEEEEQEQERKKRGEDESRRNSSARDSETEAEAKERERLDAQKRRENQILEEQRRREERRLQEEREKEAQWKEMERKREEQRKKVEEEKVQRRRELEESLSSKRGSSTTSSDANDRGQENKHGQQQIKGEEGRGRQDDSSSSREESSSAHSSELSSSDSSSTSASSSGSSTPIQTPRDAPKAATHLQINEEMPRPASPLPSPSSSQDRAHLSAARDDTPPLPRAYSPVPPPAMYRDRRSDDPRAVTRAQIHQEPPRPASPPPSLSPSQDRAHLTAARDNEASMPRAYSPVPPPAMYRDRRSERQSVEPAGQSEPERTIVSPGQTQVAYNQTKKRMSPSNSAESSSSSSEESSSYESSSSESESGSDAEAEEEREYEMEPGTPLKASASDNGPRQSKKSDVDEVDHNRHSTDDESNEDSGTDNSRRKNIVPRPDDGLRYQSNKGDTDAENGNVASRTAAVPRLSKEEEEEDEGSETEDSSSDSDSSTSASTSSHGSDAVRTTVQSPGFQGKHADDKTQSGAAHDDGQGEGESLPRSGESTPPAKAYKGRVIDLLSGSPDSLDQLSNILLNKAQVDELASYLEKTDTVKQICLSNNGLDDDDLQKLTAAICASSAEPVMLNLTANNLTQDSVKHILTMLMVKPSIKLLSLQSNAVGDKGVEELVKGLQILHQQARNSRKTQEVNSLDTMSLSSEASSVAGLSSNKYLLQGLDLSDTSISDVGARHVAQLVSANVYIEALGLSHNPGVTVSQGWKEIGLALSRNRCLRNLILDGNALGDGGLGHVAKGLQGNRALRTLTLQDCEIGTAGGKTLVELLKKNTTLQELVLSPGNTVPDSLAGDIQKYLALNRTPYNSFTFY